MFFPVLQEAETATQDVGQSQPPQAIGLSVVPPNNGGLQLMVQRPLSTGERIRQWANTIFRCVNACTNVADFVDDYV